jgi:hypothetical protein
VHGATIDRLPTHETIARGGRHRTNVVRVGKIEIAIVDDRCVADKCVVDVDVAHKDAAGPEPRMKRFTET